MEGYLYTPTKNNTKTNNKTAVVVIASAINATINEWIMLFGESEEDVHLFEGR